MLPSRRALLAVPALLAGPAWGQEGDGSLTRVARSGVLRVSIGFWAAELLAQENGGTARLRDGFHEGMALLIAERLGIRAALQTEQAPGDGRRGLLAGEVDLLLAPPLTRELLRDVMFCTPHLSLDLVLLGRGQGGSYRDRANLQSQRLATLTVLAPAIAERRTLSDLPDLLPVSDPWLLAQYLLQGLVDGVIVTNVMARLMMRRFPGAGLRAQFALTSSPFGGAVAYGAHDLMRALNQIIEELQLDGSLPSLFRQETGLTLTPPFPS
ncbi:transporter substrate-binding domain-containing protein [Sediminicoccus sp. KRV36]|uniref:substrate-binding periplasmic protein n=1 Tax=Sediminicoccus sp. KRV36 TaxID=3133721 RepID=UPI00200F4EFB|nr:transporter substrate-binding domain-containing protein [Sediminicoccus rosea]UPY37047.1 transporter substrate-binding domain-containing protein [Sediminicoccus rosea]